MKVNGKTILKHDVNYDYMIKYNNFCHDKLVEFGYTPNGYDMKTEKVCVMKFKDPKKTWDSEGRKIYHFDSFIDAAEDLIGITREVFENERKNDNE